MTLRVELKGKSLRERFDAQVSPEPTSGCWLWTGALSRGYGNIQVDGRKVLATKASMWLYGSVPLDDRRWRLHKCDNRACVNPDHLYAGTATENGRDRCKRGRGKELRVDDVLRIRDRLRNGATQASIAREFNRSQGAISFIANRKTWGYV